MKGRDKIGLGREIFEASRPLDVKKFQTYGKPYKPEAIKSLSEVKVRSTGAVTWGFYGKVHVLNPPPSPDRKIQVIRRRRESTPHFTVPRNVR